MTAIFSCNSSISLSTKEHHSIFEMAYEFGQKQIAPNALAWEKDGTIPKELWKQAGELGLGGIYVSEKYGGSGLNRLDASLIFEAMAMACPSVSSFLTMIPSPTSSL